MDRYRAPDRNIDRDTDRDMDMDMDMDTDMDTVKDRGTNMDTNMDKDRDTDTNRHKDTDMDKVTKMNSEMDMVMDMNAVEVRTDDGTLKKSTLKTDRYPQLRHHVVIFLMPNFDMHKKYENQLRKVEFKNIIVIGSI
jgi:hypothetical protein